MQLVAAGAPIHISGSARHDPDRLFSSGLRPKHKIELFETLFFLSNVRQTPELRFLLAYVVQKNQRTGHQEIFPRIFYKDLSLAWRAASHFTIDDGEFWVGKGDVRLEQHAGEEMVVSDESTTDLPLEMQSACESLLSWVKKPRGGQDVLEMVLRRGPKDRLEPYRDFTEPRRRAAKNRKNLIHGGQSIARFRRRNDPTSLKIVKGFEPDFDTGIIERTQTKSTLYGGQLQRFRILSRNRKIQYYFVAGPRHVWIFPPQALTTELSSYGVRTISVVADDDLFIPGYEYHYFEETCRGLELYSQIPKGFAGDICLLDDAKADASPWLDQIPVIQKFRRQVLHQKV